MTSLDKRPISPEGPDSSAPAERDHPKRQPRRRRRAPAAHPFFRFVFPALVVAAGVAVFFLWQEGTRAVLDSSDGADVPEITDPTAPGYVAFAEPTPTMLVAHVDQTDALVGVSVFARTKLDEGGTLVLLSRDMIIESPGHESVLLGNLYAAEGVAGLEREVGAFMGFGFTEDPMVMMPENLAQLMGLVAPIPFRLVDDLFEVDADGNVSVAIESGSRGFDSDTLAAVYGWRNPAEVDAARLVRQEAVWKAWFAAIGSAEDLTVATLGAQEQLPAYLRSLGGGRADVSSAPVTAVVLPDGEKPVYVLRADEADWPHRKGLEMVPLPIGHEPGARPTVQLLDGVGDIGARNDMLLEVVAAGTEVRVIGNASAFDVGETVVSYHDPVDETVAIDLAAALGVAVEFVEDPNQPADLTVTIGG